MTWQELYENKVQALDSMMWDKNRQLENVRTDLRNRGMANSSGFAEAERKYDVNLLDQPFARQWQQYIKDRDFAETQMKEEAKKNQQIQARQQYLKYLQGLVQSRLKDEQTRGYQPQYGGSSVRGFFEQFPDQFGQGQESQPWADEMLRQEVALPSYEDWRKKAYGI
jgi:hypothetical protein